MNFQLLRAILVFFALSRAAFGAAPEAPAPASFASATASADARYAVHWITAHSDNQKLPFVVVDKKSARIFVFEAAGRMRGETAVLLGAAIGDTAATGAGSRSPDRLLPHEQTTPAGRFVSEPGHNLHGEDIVWVDYDARIAIHRLRPAPAHERRAARMESLTSEDNRISLGCIVVPVDFYESVVRPVLGRGLGVVYVLPETRSVGSAFAELQAILAAP